ncbi:M20 family metallopeptidase [Tissierella creatinini]|nr:M20 family metallopeptidase [Tissierella creatinini]TJX64335.1 M20 family metallopeptidase [Soehngenia saccharolytica]
MFRELIEKHSADILELNDYMADNPEISSNEFNSSRRMVDLLREKGLEVEFPFAGIETAFKATINNGKKRKAAILVEYDALRGLGHACGHCASGSISLLAGLLLNDIKDKIDAQIDIIGTPDEEMAGAKVLMANNGIFNGYDFAIMIHMNNKSYMYSKSLALDSYEFEFFGKPSHAAASPWDGNNALNAMRLFFDALDMMRQHVKPDVRIHGVIKSGGEAANIIPNYSMAEFNVRSEHRAYLDYVSQWVMDCARAAALATRTTLKVRQRGEKYNEQIENKLGCRILEEIYRDLGIETCDGRNIVGGSSDIGNVDYICPVLQPYLSIGEDYGIHTVEFANAMKTPKTHEKILKGGEIIASFIYKIYNEPDLLEEMISEHKKARNRE